MVGWTSSNPSVFTLKDKNTILYVDRPDRMFVPIKKYPFILFLNDKLYPVFFYAEWDYYSYLISLLLVLKQMNYIGN